MRNLKSLIIIVKLKLWSYNYDRLTQNGCKSKMSMVCGRRKLWDCLLIELNAMRYTSTQRSSASANARLLRPSCLALLDSIRWYAQHCWAMWLSSEELVLFQVWSSVYNEIYADSVQMGQTFVWQLAKEALKELFSVCRPSRETNNNSCKRWASKDKTTSKTVKTILWAILGRIQLHNDYKNCICLHNTMCTILT